MSKKQQKQHIQPRLILARPHSHVDSPHVSHLPLWVSIGGVLLSFITGYINSIGFLNKHAISHVTGLITQLAIEVAYADWKLAIGFGLTILFFFLGALLSGIIIQQSTLQFGRRYGVALMIESLLLFLCVPLLIQENNLGYYLAALACGLQNAMATTYSGTIIRTSHLTGFITDFGVALGHMLRGWKIDTLRFKLYGAITFGFFSGGVVGVWVSNLFGFAALIFPAILVGCMGLGYYSYVQYLRNTNRLI